VAGDLIESARGVGYHEHFIALLDGGKSRKGYADFGNHAGDDELLAAGLLHRIDEILIVPGVDVAGPGDVGRVPGTSLSVPVRAARSGRSRSWW